MDVEGATRKLLEPNAAGYLSDAATARRNGKDINPRVLVKELTGMQVSDVVVKRNVVFMQWKRGLGSGVLVVSWNQDGKVANLDLHI